VKKEHEKKKPPKTDRQKKAEAEMMKKLAVQYVSMMNTMFNKKK